MVVELALPAVIPGLLVGLHYGVQISRPLWGHRSDIGNSRTRWIVGGLALLAASGTAAAATTFLFEVSFAAGLIAAIAAYVLIGIGVGASGTSLLALIATKIAPDRRASAATITWLMMIAGIVLTSIITGICLDPYSHGRLVVVTAVTGLVVLVISAAAIGRLERRPAPVQDRNREQAGSFVESAREIWRDPAARLLTIFIFLSMLAYSTQDLILEPFAGLLFDMTPGQTTQLSGVQHAGVFCGMALVGIIGALYARRKPALMKIFIVSGCIGSGLALGGLAVSAAFAPLWPIAGNVFILGFMNGLFAVAAIGTMMTYAGAGKQANEGMRMGVWGAAQAISFGLGGLVGTIALTAGRWIIQEDGPAFALVFLLEASLFLVSAAIALRIGIGIAARPVPDHDASLALPALAAE
jgi:MFS transporter, BCD family, chlorophyll transporter